MKLCACWARRLEVRPAGASFIAASGARGEAGAAADADATLVFVVGTAAVGRSGCRGRGRRQRQGRRRTGGGAASDRPDAPPRQSLSRRRQDRRPLARGRPPSVIRGVKARRAARQSRRKCLAEAMKPRSEVRLTRLSGKSPLTEVIGCAPKRRDSPGVIVYDDVEIRVRRAPNHAGPRESARYKVGSWLRAHGSGPCRIVCRDLRTGRREPAVVSRARPAAVRRQQSTDVE